MELKGSEHYPAEEVLDFADYTEGGKQWEKRVVE
jgi:hypothetical protein